MPAALQVAIGRALHVAGRSPGASVIADLGAHLMRTEGSVLLEQVVVATATDVGCVRQVNEDAVHILRATVGPQPHGLLAVVCDGMGGHAAGDVASRMAIDTIVREWRAVDDGAEALERALKVANRSIYTASMNNRELGGMGTTCVAMIIRDGKAWCAHVGDSRCYRYRNGALHRMTEDHSAVMELVRRGEITIAAARTHPHRNVIRRALGAKGDVEVTLWSEPATLLPGDQYLLSSDGLHDVVDDYEMCQLLAENAPRRACDLLVELAKSRGAPDNVTVALLAVCPAVEHHSTQVFEPVHNARLDERLAAMPAPSH